jgi:ABC-type sugar transport system substrate-binding protein
MKTILRSVCILALAVLMLAAAGCGVIEHTDSSTYVLGYSTPSMQNSFWISVATAMKQKADELGVSLSIRDAASDTAQQASDIEDLVEQRVDVLLVTPYDSLSLGSAFKQANEAGIPIIVVDIGINDPDVTYESLIITDNYAGGRIAGEWLVSYFRDNRIENPTVATIEAQLGAENARERHNGFIDVMEENDINVVLGRSANSLRDEAMEVMEDFLQAYPELTAVFAECDDMALGALQAVKQAKAATVIVGYDGNLAACEQIQEGSNLKADIDQKPAEMGELAVQMAVDLINGVALEKMVTITPELITRDNVDAFIEKHGQNS